MSIHTKLNQDTRAVNVTSLQNRLNQNVGIFSVTPITSKWAKMWEHSQPITLDLIRMMAHPVICFFPPLTSFLIGATLDFSSLDVLGLGWHLWRLPLLTNCEKGWQSGVVQLDLQWEVLVMPDHTVQFPYPHHFRQ